ncbi:hypothetical protein CBDKU1_34510 [Clostridium butyricum DKU-01]|nr:hypothetical protein CBDKU1_34510 [Clostridium butyricum DKU-01]
METINKIPIIIKKRRNLMSEKNYVQLVEVVKLQKGNK